MALITAQDIYRHLYKEIVDELTRFDGADDADNQVLNQAIASAIKETKMYLSRFDLLALFGDDTTEPTVDDVFLKDICVQIAIWRIANKGNAGIDFDVARKTYDAAIRTLKSIQDGGSQPEGWPYRDTTGQDAPNGDAIEWTSNPKRINHF